MKKHSQWIWILIGLFSLIGLMALLWRPTVQPIPIILSHYADSTGKMGISEAISAFDGQQFKPIQRTNFGLTSANHWLYFQGSERLYTQEFFNRNYESSHQSSSDF